MAYPVVSFPPRHSRINVDNEPAAFYAGTTAQASTVGASNMDQLGAPSGSIGYYKFSNPGNSTATAIFTIHWEELPVK